VSSFLTAHQHIHVLGYSVPDDGVAVQAVIALLTGLAVLYHFCMRNDAELLKKVKEPAVRNIQAFKDWIRSKLDVCFVTIRLPVDVLIVSCESVRVKSETL